MSAVRSVFLTGVLAAVCAVLAAPIAQGKTSVQKQAEEAAKRRPIAFFLARGGPNACGEGCREWIAAEGVFDTGSAKRFNAFLKELNRDDLPVFFNSPGGSVGQAVLIGAELRQRRMVVAVGRTRPDACGRMPRDACHKLMQSGSLHSAKLSIDGAQCFSACPYAYVGGSVRKVGKGARIGVHAAFTQAGAVERPGAIEQTHELLRRYAIEMGVDSGVIDIAAKVPSTRMHQLTRDEILRLGIETAPFFETRWLAFQQRDKSVGLMKTVTRQHGGGGRQAYSATIHLACANTFGLLLRYRRELQTGVSYRPAVILRVEGDSLALGNGVENANLGVWSTVASFHLLEQAVERNKLDIVESYSASANRDPQTTRISTSGLGDALAVMRKRCAGSKVSTEERSSGSRG
jgi:hypothetical protein